MNSEKKSNSNQKNSKRKNDKIKQVNRIDVEDNSTNVEDNSSSSENFQKDLIEVFDKCIELREDESDCPAVNQKLDNSTTEQHYENSKRNNIESTLYHTVNENLDLRKINCPEMNGLPMVNSAESNNCNDSNKNDKKILESNNNRQDQENGHQVKNDCPIKDTVPINTNAQLTYTNGLDVNNIKIEYKEYESEVQMQDIMKLIQAELSEPYSIYTYRYFIYNWPKLCFLATHGNKYVGAIVCKLDMHMNVVKRGYIAMLAVKKEYRKLKIGTNLVQKAIDAMLADNADEVVLETEMKNVSALRLYENLGFVRDKRLFRYYLNGVDALRLKLWFN